MGSSARLHLTMYFYAAYGSPTALLLLGSLVALSVIAWRRRSRADALVAAWILALYLPLSIAVTKAAPMTIAAAPAWGYTMARVAQLGIAARSQVRRAMTCGALLGTGLLGLGLTLLLGGNRGAGSSATTAQAQAASQPPVPPSVPPLARIVPLVLALVLSALAGAVCWLALRLAEEQSRGSGEALSWQRTQAIGRRISAIVVIAAIVGVGATWLADDWTKVTTPPVYVAPGPAVGVMIAQDTPQDASIVLLADPEVYQNANFMVMFWAHRDIYLSRDLSAIQLCAQAHVAAAKRSPFFVLSRAAQPAAGAPIATMDGWALYQPRCTS